nr:multidrug resistance-associated protein 1 [Quercus suber]
MIGPRLCLSALRLCQPLLIHSITSYLAVPSGDESNPDIARGLIAATVLLYVGIAVFGALYRRQLHRFITQLRGSIISSIHRKALLLPADKLSDNAMLTLASADVNRIASSLKQLDELFATPIEIAVAMFLLEKQIGVSCVAPIALSISISVISLGNSVNAVVVQKSWLAAVSDRVAFIAGVLQAPKGFKMLGLTNYLIDRIQELRLTELTKQASYRKYVTLRNVESSIPNAFASAVTFMMLTLIKGGHALTPTVAFTTLSLVTLLTTPIHNLIHSVPMFQTAVASLDRIQEFLLLDEIAGTPPDNVTPNGDDAWDTIELSDMSLARPSLDRPPVSLEAATIIGPAGAGKSTLLRTIMGELELSHGSRSVGQLNLGYGFCAQDPWLPNSSIRDIIIGASELDDEWYKSVISACCLTTDVSSFPNLDETVVGTKGLSLSGGQKQRLALARAVYSRKDLLIVDDVLSGLDAATAKHVFEHVLGPRGLCARHHKTIVLATHAIQFLHHASHVIALSDQGTMLERDNLDDPQGKKAYLEMLKTSQDQIGEVEPRVYSQALPKPSVVSKVDDALQDLSRRTGDSAVYRYYAKSIGWRLGVVIVGSAMTFAFCMQFPTLWVRWWSEAEADAEGSYPLGVWIGIHMLLAVMAVLSLSVNVWVMLVESVPRSSAILHKQLLVAVMQAPYSFFVGTDSGITLNRFSNDMSLIEGELAGAVLQTMDGSTVCTIAMVFIVLGARFVGLIIPFLLVVLYAIQKFYLRTSRQLRFLDLEALAQLMTHMTEIVPGVSTIRAFGWERQSHEKCLRLLDTAQRPFYLLLCVQRWLNLVLDIVTAAIATILVSLALTARDTVTAGSVGVSLLAILSFNEQLTYLINAWTSLETALGAVARCKNFEATTISENKILEIDEPPVDWPHGGELTYHGVSASYNEDSTNVLQGVSFSIASGEKVGICGRSGSGKSSLMLTLLRLLDTNAGSIHLDGHDLATLPRQTIRSRITTLPQEVLIFPGSVRENLCVGNETLPDPCVQAALQKVGLLDHLTVHHRDKLLDTPIADLALSHGQLQLFAAARALLRPSKLLVMDEVTSSVDARSEIEMLEVLLDAFRDSTVLAVAHRLQTIVDFDKVIVLHDGRVVEVGKPRELLKQQGSWFQGMWESSGH